MGNGVPLEARLRSDSETRNALYSFGRFSLELPSLVLLRDGEPVKLGQRALNLLAMLVEARGALVSRDTLMQRVWPDQAVDEGAIRVHLSAARKALSIEGSSPIVAEAGRGYRLALPVTVQRIDDPKAPSVATSNIPWRVSDVIGRDEVVGDIANELLSKRLISIVGPGGIGKTTVGLAIVRYISETALREAWFVDLAPLEQADMVVPTLATVLGVPATGTDPIAQVAASLAAKASVILLDNCEHVIDAAADIVERLLHAAPHLLVLATSREPLRADGEWVHRLAALDVPREGDAVDREKSSGFSAIALFAERARAANAEFRLDDRNVSAVVEICRRLDGIPLAIELAAARVDTMSPVAIAAALDNRFAFLNRGRRTALPRHRTLRGVLDWSYDLLATEARDLLDRLSLFRNGFDDAGAAAVRAGDGHNDTGSLVAELIAKSLIVATPSNILPYRLLDTTRHYGLERLAASGLVDQASRAHATFLLGSLSASAAAWEGKALREWLAGYSAQIDDVRSAILWASGSTGSTGDPKLAVELVIAAAPLWFHLSLPGEFLHHAESAIAMMESDMVAPDRQVELLNAYGHALWHTRGPTAAMANAFERAMTLAQELGSAPLMLRALWGVWAQSILDGRYEESLALARTFEADVGSEGALPDRQTAAHMLALSYHFSGDHAEADRMLAIVMTGDAAPERASHANHAQVDGRIAVLSLLMRLHWMRGDLTGALALARECAEDAERIDHALSICYGLAIGCVPVAIAAGETTLAREWIDALSRRTIRHGLDHWHAFAAGYGAALDRSLQPPATVSGMQTEMFAVAADPRAAVPWRPNPLTTLRDA